MTDVERRRWKRNAGKAEAFLLSCLDNSDLSYVQRVKAAELILYQYYGRPAVGAQGAAGGSTIALRFDGPADYCQ